MARGIGAVAIKERCLHVETLLRADAFCQTGSETPFTVLHFLAEETVFGFAAVISFILTKSPMVHWFLKPGLL